MHGRSNGGLKPAYLKLEFDTKSLPYKNEVHALFFWPNFNFK